jgi:hypothetical protein
MVIVKMQRVPSEDILAAWKDGKCYCFTESTQRGWEEILARQIGEGDLFTPASEEMIAEWGLSEEKATEEYHVDV